MKKGRIRFLAEGEAPPLPGWTRLLPAAWREYYPRSRSPYHIEEQAGVWEGILHTRKEGITGDGWRQNATALLDEMRQNGHPQRENFRKKGCPLRKGGKSRLFLPLRAQQRLCGGRAQNRHRRPISLLAVSPGFGNRHSVLWATRSTA